MKCFVSSFTLGINSEKVHFRCMASQPPSLEMLVLTTSVAGCPKSFECFMSKIDIEKKLMKRIPTNPMLQGLISNYFQLLPIPFKLQILGRYKIGHALASNSRQGSQDLSRMKGMESV